MKTVSANRKQFLSEIGRLEIDLWPLKINLTNRRRWRQLMYQIQEKDFKKSARYILCAMIS